MNKIQKFDKHLLLKEIGVKGQEKIHNAKILIVGLGGLGSPCIRYLASSGVNNFCLIDDDIIELDNLPRQNNYLEQDLDSSKVEISAQLIKSLNPEAKIKLIAKRLAVHNIADYMANYNYIIDASDNFKTKFLIADLCRSKNKTLISASFVAFNGYLSVYKKSNSLPCFRCFHHEDIDTTFEKACFRQGVFAPAVGVVGTFMAAETIKEILGFKNSLAGKIMLFNFITNNHRVSKIILRKNCRCRS
ncbi:MAG: HesA/MoeB/ThiF family protein [Rickettsiales bacterium]